MVPTPTCPFGLVVTQYDALRDAYQSDEWMPKGAFDFEDFAAYFPITQDMTQLWEPAEDTRSQLMRRLGEETARRGQPVPEISVDRPPPSEGYQRRMARMKTMAGRTG